VDGSDKLPDRTVTACHDGGRTNREATMRAQALAHEITIDRVDLEALDKFLRSDRSPPNSMMLSELDGLLTGIAIGPELIRPSEWLPLIWGGKAPEFASLDEANAILVSLMARYNEILREIADDALAPIFWTDRNGTVIAMDWAEGFLQAIKLRADAWEPLFTSKREGKLLFPSCRSAAIRTAPRCSGCRLKPRIASWSRRRSSSRIA
jgi:yecA family protein